MDNQKELGVLGSSVNPRQISATVSGALLASSALLIGGARVMGIDIAESQVALVAEQIGLAAGSLWFLWGILRKAAVWVSGKFGK
jgi:hypothetical protein